jgi:hypothetical protein
MNLTRLALLAATLLIAGCQCNKNNNTDDTGPEDLPPERDRGQWLSMGTLSDGTIVASYFDRGEDGLGVAFGTPGGEGGVTWRYEEVEGFQGATGLDSGNLGTHTSLVVAPDDVIWVVYYDIGNAALRYARRHKTVSGRGLEPGGTWVTGVADTGGGSRPDAGMWASIALNPEGKPVVAHYDVGQGELRVTRWDGEAFGDDTVLEGEEYTLQDTGGPSKPADIGKFADLFIAADGTEYIAYYDDAWSRLMLAVGGSAGFEQYVIDETADVGQWPSLHVADDGTVHIAYQDVEGQNLRYAVGVPGSGGFERTVVDDGELIGADTEIFANGDMLSILYFDGQNNDLKQATLAGGSWTTATLAGDDGRGLGYHNEVVVSNGTYYAGCYDYTDRTIWLGTIQ